MTETWTKTSVEKAKFSSLVWGFNCWNTSQGRKIAIEKQVTFALKDNVKHEHVYAVALDFNLFVTSVHVPSGDISKCHSD